MDKTVLIPSEGKKKLKFTGVSPEQTEVLKKDRNNLFKVLAAMGGAYLAFDTYQNLTNISREQWDDMLPEELENFLSPILDAFVDVDETIAECEDELPTDPLGAENTAIPVAPQETESEPNETIAGPQEINIQKDVVETLEELEIDDDLIIDATINEADFTVDENMVEYINSDEILADLNEQTADAVIINDDYIMTEEIEIPEDLSADDELIYDEDFYYDEELWDMTDEEWAAYEQELMEMDWDEFLEEMESWGMTEEDLFDDTILSDESLNLYEEEYETETDETSSDGLEALVSDENEASNTETNDTENYISEDDEMAAELEMDYEDYFEEDLEETENEYVTEVDVYSEELEEDYEEDFESDWEELEDELDTEDDTLDFDDIPDNL